jgi:hypothetical protein
MIDELDYAYATQRLDELGNSIYDKDKELLDYVGGRRWKIDPIKTSIMVGESLLDEEQQIVKISTSDDLAYLGYRVVSQNLDRDGQMYFRGQKKFYYLERIDFEEDKMKMPDGHVVEYALKDKKIRLVGRGAGPMGIGSWVSLKPPEKSAAKDYRDIINSYSSLGVTKKKVMLTEMKIPEIPVMISKQGELVCIPNSKDEITAAWVGRKRTGKSFSMHGVVDRAYWKGGRGMIVLNDYLNECKSWALPWKYDALHLEHSFNKQLKKIGEHTLPLPAIFITPVTSTLYEYTGQEAGIGFKMSFPFKKLINEYTFYLKEKKEWRMSNSGRYFRLMKDDLIKCKSMEEMEDVVMHHPCMPIKEKGMRNKILSVLQDIFDSGFLDVGSGVSPFWKVKLKDGHIGSYTPIVAAMLAGLVPVVQTREVKAKDYFPQYFRYLVDDIFDKQINDEYFKKIQKKVWLVVDELTLISSTDMPGPASDVLQRCVTVGGPSRIGFIYATQNYTKIPVRIRSNTSYVFAFRFNSDEEANEIAKDFNLSSDQQRKILSLKKFEMLGITSEKFICYDSEGNRYEREDPIEGYALPPLSMHKPPSKEERDYETSEVN